MPTNNTLEPLELRFHDILAEKRAALRHAVLGNAPLPQQPVHPQPHWPPPRPSPIPRIPAPGEPLSRLARFEQPGAHGIQMHVIEGRLQVPVAAAALAATCPLALDERPGIQVICQATELRADRLHIFPSGMLVRIDYLRLHLPQNELSDADTRIHL